MDTPTLSASERARRNVARRWENATQAEKDASGAHMRAAQAARAVIRAREQAQRLGITLTAEQAESAGAQLLRHEQAERADVARVAALAARAAQVASANANWGAGQLLTYHALGRKWAPAIPPRELADRLAVGLRDELDSPDGFSRPRLTRRLQAIVLGLRSDA